MRCKGTTFCRKTSQPTFILIVKNFANYQIVKFLKANIIILLSLCTKTISFRYKTSKTKNKNEKWRAETPKRRRAY